ncbi:unnamed protein product [Paramecium octaurelia]|uniref:Uncharacterized protein n=1 Tax=Paramecium octaurelia TaxID=43137 RepID=A0A8S1WUR1_PAROT|nr:unnamed protein product [Paramecium octaurelia]
MNLNQAKMFNCNWKNIKIHELNKLDGHCGIVNQVCFSPDGKLLASCSDDNSIILWDVKTGKIKSRIKVKEKGKSVCFLHNTLTVLSSNKMSRMILFQILLMTYVNVQLTPESRINLQGLAIGNECTDPTVCTHAARQFQVHFFHQIGGIILQVKNYMKRQEV